RSSRTAPYRGRRRDPRPPTWRDSRATADTAAGGWRLSWGFHEDRIAQQSAAARRVRVDSEHRGPAVPRLAVRGAARPRPLPHGDDRAVAHEGHPHVGRAWLAADGDVDLERRFGRHAQRLAGDRLRAARARDEFAEG